MAETIGYSGTPLWKKLGFKTGMKVAALNAPMQYQALLADGPNDWVFVNSADAADAIHIFIMQESALENISLLSRHLPPAQMLWVSWPKLSSPLSTGLCEDDIRATALACGLVDVKVCAVDANWSGLKLVRRKTAKKR
jgi:hypothetical protein